MTKGSLPPILVVDDNEDNAEIIRQYLEIRGYPVTVAHNGDEALERFETVRPAVVLLDVMMPGRDGWELLLELKRDRGTREIPVVLCSVLDEPRLALSLGAAGYLHKPIDQGQLVGALSRFR